jgi:hypothetical protein
LFSGSLQGIADLFSAQASIEVLPEQVTSLPEFIRQFNWIVHSSPQSQMAINALQFRDSFWSSRQFWGGC